MTQLRTPSIPNVRFVLFDAVGTLIHVQPSVAEIYLAVGRRFGSRLTRDQIGEQFAASMSRLHEGGPTDELRERARWRAIVAEVLHDIPHAGDRSFEELWEAFAKPEQWSLFADVTHVWQELERRGFTLGIASNFDLRLQSLCRAFPPLDSAAHVFVSSQIGFPKPHPEFYRRIERALHARPEQILLVGDSLVHDVNGARSAGWQAVHLNRNANVTEDRWITSLTGLLDTL